MTKTILVPTDFSTCAGKAVNFAGMLARHMDVKLLLLHVFDIPASPAPLSYREVSDEVHAVSKHAAQKLGSICAELAKTGVKADFMVRRGSVSDTILGVAEGQHPYFIVMGTRGSNSPLIFGSTTVRVMHGSESPVIAIPDSALVPSTLKMIVYAADFRSTDITALERIRELAIMLNSGLKIVHFETPETDEAASDAFMKKAEEITRHTGLPLQLLSGKNIYDSLRRYAHEGATDLIVLSAGDHSFFEKLMHKSVARDLLLNSEVPVLVFHVHHKVPERI